MSGLAVVDAGIAEQVAAIRFPAILHHTIGRAGIR